MIESLRHVFGVLLGIVDSKHLENYNLNMLQVCICADIIGMMTKKYEHQTAKAPSVLALLTAGQGKTCIMVLLIYYRMVQVCSGSGENLSSLDAYNLGKLWSPEKIMDEFKTKPAVRDKLRVLVVVCNEYVEDSLNMNFGKFFGELLNVIPFHITNLENTELK